MPNSVVLGALLIFFMRIVDVSIGTVRLIVLVRGQRTLAGVLGFFESLIWLTATAQVVTNLDNPVKLVAFCGGFACGTITGSTIEKWLAMGKKLVRIVTSVDTPAVAQALRHKGFYVTAINAEGRDGGVRIDFSIVPRKAVPRMLRIVQEANPKAFITIEEITTASVASVSNTTRPGWAMRLGVR
ncbi:MAG: DUF2179 domain-containing protein [Trueperaceae bacterium]|nr:MAG: DUF2179 domain-containing protein [Trueperaceae bacterium]